MHVISQIIDGGATEADGGASAPVGPSVAMPLLLIRPRVHKYMILKIFDLKKGNRDRAVS